MSQAPSPGLSFPEKRLFAGQFPHKRCESFFNRKTGKDENKMNFPLKMPRPVFHIFMFSCLKIVIPSSACDPVGLPQ